MRDTEKNEILSLSKDLGELAIDSLLKDGIFKDIPFIGTGISVGKLLNSLSDRILLTKIIHFINELNLKDEQEVLLFKEKYFKDSDYSKIGSKILLTLEKTDEAIKIKWLAKSLRLFIDKEITNEEFLRISSIINSSYVTDILKINAFKELDTITSNNDLIESYSLDHLFSIGLLESRGIDGGSFDGSHSGTIYGFNYFGKIMIEKII